ncbi:unnamed protein product [Phyllotreta striolata]|uniref:PHD-type domain-containing protein n=1 Tax=Phyllotreta striolata TaxID=444603 RepID=A0A9N9XWW6_PHYSR|nr:unnamed protein product [Phyllotreta striolata]
MSGGPPHHPHNRQVPGTNINTVWNHRLQIPNFFPRHPQVAHMSNEHSLLHQPTWHTPTTEALKIHPPPHVLSEMFKNESLFPRDCVDLTVTRNGSQNGELPPTPVTPISLSVRDANKINSLPASALDIQAVELTKSTSPVTRPASPGRKTSSPSLKSSSPGLLVHNPNSPGIFSPGSSLSVTAKPLSQNLTSKSVSPIPKAPSPGLKPASPNLKCIQGLPSSTTVDLVKTQQKRSNVRVDSILERLNPQSSIQVEEKPAPKPAEEKPEAPPQAGAFDENSNSSSIVNTSILKDEDTISTNSNEDSLDSTKSRRKRKPCKTIRVTKDGEKADDVESTEKDPISLMGEMLEENKNPDKEESTNDLEELISTKSRRKTSSESETIDDIAAMVQEGLKEKEQKQKTLVRNKEEATNDNDTKPVSISVIKVRNLNEQSSDNLPEPKASSTHFVEVENKLEEMFAGIEDSSDPVKTNALAGIEDTKTDDPLSKLDDSIAPVTDDKENIVLAKETDELKADAAAKTDDRISSSTKKTKRKASGSAESNPKKKKLAKGKDNQKKLQKVKPGNKADSVKDVYAYDSGSNTSSTKSKGPFVQIKGPRDSPLSVNIVNSSLNDDDGERKLPKAKKYHDDLEYRHKVRSKGLHSSTLSHKYDAQTKDATWICAFCKRGPHASELSGPTHSTHGNNAPPGDLFGPYFITTQCPEFERRLDDPYDRQFKSRKITKALDAETTSMKSKKTKRKHSESLSEPEDVYRGITDTGNRTYEVWAHEDCIVWSPGTYLIGPKIVGLEEAVWTCCNVSCKLCRLKGANVSCLRRGCLNVMHVCCARLSDWLFLDGSYKAYCAEHRILVRDVES